MIVTLIILGGILGGLYGQFSKQIYNGSILLVPARTSGVFIEAPQKNISKISCKINRWIFKRNTSVQKSLWQGECFVFDQRVAIKHGLQVGEFDQCYACRYPLSQDDIKSEKYTPGISCPYCYNTHTPEKLKGLTERQRQVILAKSRGLNHIGHTNADSLSKEMKTP